MKGLLCLVLLLGFPVAGLAESAMNQDTLENIVKGMASSSKGEKGVVEFTYKDVKMYLISDPGHDRMRIIAPVAQFDKLSLRDVDAILESNFHKALDARYAVSDGVLYSAYIHPLSPLTEEQIKSAMAQVSNLASSFGREYSSGSLVYGSN